MKALPGWSMEMELIGQLQLKSLFSILGHLDLLSKLRLNRTVLYKVGHMLIGQGS